MIQSRFKVLDEVKKQFTTKFYIGSDGYIYNWSDEILEDCKLIQYTGLEDTNGVKIYEGDIVIAGGFKQVVNTEIRTIRAGDGCYVVRPILSGYGSSLRYVRVIGNIYQNPELVGN